MMKKLKVLDLFAGAGGLSNGFEQTNQFKVKKAIELNKAARLTYAANHDNVEIDEDITKVCFTVSNGEIKEEFKEIDVIIGGPPCQGFSNANRQKNSLISNNNQLIKEYIRAIEEIKPIGFIMENVKNMNSKTHKFYLTSSDSNEELNFLNVIVHKEKINISEETEIFEEMKEFIAQISNQEDTDLYPYILKEDVFSKLNTVYRLLKVSNLNKVNEFFKKTKNYKFFQKNLKNWESSHHSYWHETYKEEWGKLAELLEEIVSNEHIDVERLHYSLKQIIENQKLLRKFQEIFEHNIVYDEFYVAEGSVDIELYTYNVFEFLLSKLKSLGYVLNEEKHIFNAAEYGVSQVRRRLILIGVRKEEMKTKQVIVPEPLFANKSQYYTIYDAIGDLENEVPKTDIESLSHFRKKQLQLNNKLNKYLNNVTNGVIHNHVMTESSELALRRFKFLKEGQNFHDLDESLKTSYSDHSRTQNTIYKRLKYDSASDTVINVRKSMWIHPNKDRALSIREAARLQSFQDSYIFKGSKDQQYQQIGNAVPPLLARHVAESLLSTLGIQVLFPIKEELKKERSTLATTGYQ